MRPLPAQLVVLAKRPVPGRVKTRLCPPLTPVQAAAVACASLADTLAAAARAPFARRVLALADGTAGGTAGGGVISLPPGFELAGQCGGGLDERIAAAMAGAYARLPLPVLLIGMDTPQLTPGLLTDGARMLAAGDADAVLGPARDGGFWLLGMRRPSPGLVRGVPMSSPVTGRAQRERLRRAGLRVATAPVLVDVDTVGDARDVARQAPGSRFASAFAAAVMGAVPPAA